MAVLEALHVPYELQQSSEAEAPYDPAFAARTLAEKTKGDYKIIQPEDLWK